MTMTKAEDYLNEVIRLQLRKPRKWNWQLSTSKSSPHISLPTIQLYDAKGHLLLQTKDNGGSQRQTWNSSQIDVTKGSRDQQRHLQRCRSDNLDHRINKEQSRNNNSTTGNNKALANSSWDSRKPDSKHLQRCRSDTLNTAGNPYRRAHPDVAERANRSNKKGHNVNYGDRNVNGKLDTTAKEKPEIRHSDDEGNNKGCNTINERNEDSKELHHLQKSKSDILQVKSKKPHKSYPIQPNRSLTGLIVETRHARSRSDDAFTRKMWQSEESIKRAELDGYRNFITPYIPEETKDESKNEDKKTKKNNNLVLATAEEVCFNNKASCAVEVDNPKPIKYSLRGSRAGILVVAEEPHPHTHRRRRRRDGSKSRDRSKTLEQINVERENAVGTTSTENGTSKHFRQVSDPTGAGIGFRNRLRIRQPYCPQDDSEDKRKARRTDSKTTETKETIPPKVRENGLFYSQSDVFPFKHLIDGCEKLDRNCNYSVQHPVTTNNNECHKNSETITENPRKKKLRKVQRRHTDGGASSSCNEENDGKPMGESEITLEISTNYSQKFIPLSKSQLLFIQRELFGRNA